MAPAVKGGKIMGSFKWSVGTDQPKKCKKLTCKVVAIQN